MDERTYLFLEATGPVLCIDIGSHVQNAVLARPGISIENWPSFCFPSPAQMIAQRIREMTILKRGIWLYGNEMGGGFGIALREHIAAELPTAMTMKAAMSIHDNLETVKGMGIQISEICPKNCVPIFLSDYEPAFWSSILNISCLPLPHMIIAAARDHGNFMDGNRQARMKTWQNLLSINPDPVNWIYADVPESMHRLKALQAQTGGPVADSTVCAILGILCDENIMNRSYKEGITIINMGNSHTLAALIYQGKVVGIYEHHTDTRELSLLLEDLRQFRNRWLTQEHVHQSGGNGVTYARHDEAAGDYSPTFIIGPKRNLLLDDGKFIAPYGNMTNSGCYGLLFGWAKGHYFN